MANGARSLGLCTPISVIQGRCQVVLGKKRQNEDKNKNKNKSAVCSYLHSPLPNNKASINADGTLLGQNYIPRGATGAMLRLKKKTYKQDFSAVAVLSRHGRFLRSSKTDTPKLTCGGEMWAVFLCFNFVSCPDQ